MLRLVPLVLGLAVATPAHAELPGLAVIDLVDKGAGAELAANLTDVMIATLGDLGVFAVLSRDDIKRILEMEIQKQAMGCESDASCLADIGGALGVSLLVSGSVGKVGEATLLSFTLTDSQSVKVLAREQREVKADEDLTDAVRSATKLLVRELLQKGQGFLVLDTEELGANVEVDGKLIGVTPLGRQTLASGPHRITVSKDGFVTWARDVTVQPEQTLVNEATLVPSVEFIEDYDQEANLWRNAAYITGGLGALATVAGAYLWAKGSGDSDDYEDEIEADGCRAGSVVATRADNCSRFTTWRDDISGTYGQARLSLIAGLTLMAGAAVVYEWAPAPGRYDAYKPSTAPVATLVPLPGGGALATVKGGF